MMCPPVYRVVVVVAASQRRARVIPSIMIIIHPQSTQSTKASSRNASKPPASSRTVIVHSIHLHTPISSCHLLTSPAPPAGTRRPTKRPLRARHGRRLRHASHSRANRARTAHRFLAARGASILHADQYIDTVLRLYKKALN